MMRTLLRYVLNYAIKITFWVLFLCFIAVMC